MRCRSAAGVPSGISGWQRKRRGTREASGIHEKRTHPACRRAAVAVPRRRLFSTSGSSRAWTRPITVTREGGGFRVHGDRPERWVAMTDLDNPQAVAYLQRRLRRAGVDDLLAEAGAAPGDEVVVGGAAFEFTPYPLAGTRGRDRPRRPR